MSFRKYGGLQYSSKNHAVSSNYNTSNNLLVTQNFGQPDSYVNFESDISGNINIDIGGNAHIGGNLDISGNENISGNLDVSGNSLLRNGVSINYPQGHLQNTNYALDISGNERVIGNLDISGNGILTVGTSLFTNTGKLNINENVGTGPYTQTSPRATPVPFISGGSQVYAGSLVIRHNNEYGYSSILFPCRTGYPNFGDYGYIQYFESVNEGFPEPVTESGLLLIGIENDAPYSRISLYPNKGTGFVGINTMYPQYSLDISGNERVTGNLDISGNLTVSGYFNFASTSSNYPLASPFNNPTTGYIGYTINNNQEVQSSFTGNYVNLYNIGNLTGVWLFSFSTVCPNFNTQILFNYGLTNSINSWSTPNYYQTYSFPSNSSELTYTLHNNYIFNSTIWNNSNCYIQLYYNSNTGYGGARYTTYYTLTRIA